MVGALATAIGPLYRTLSVAKAAKRPEIEFMLFCVMLSDIMLLAAVTLLSQGYSLYLPLIIALSLVVTRAARIEIAAS